jgi:hypothetical protein
MKFYRPLLFLSWEEQTELLFLSVAADAPSPIGSCGKEFKEIKAAHQVDFLEKEPVGMFLVSTNVQLLVLLRIMTVSICIKLSRSFTRYSLEYQKTNVVKTLVLFLLQQCISLPFLLKLRSYRSTQLPRSCP